jgi:hypothetical protein
MEDYQSKYLKYKMKYLFLKNKYFNQTGGVTEDEFKTYLQQRESAERRRLSPEPVYKEAPEPINQYEDALERASLEQQLMELGLSQSPTLKESLAPEKYAQMQKLFEQAKRNKRIKPRNLKPNYKIDLSPEEVDILDKQLAELYNESDKLSHSAPIKQIDRMSTELSASAPIRTN